MALTTKIGVILVPGSTGNQIVTIGFDFDVILFWSEASTATGSGNNSYMPSIGALDKSGNQWALSNYSQNGIAEANCTRIGKNDKCILLVTSSVLAEAEYVSKTSTTFTLDWTTISANRRINYLAFGGLNDAKVGSFTGATSTGDQDVTTAGFEPDTLLIAGVSQSAFGSFSDSSLFSLGLADSNLNQEGIGTVNHDIADPSASDRYYSQSNIINRITTAGVISRQAALTSILANGFRLNWSTVPVTGDLWCYIAIQGLDSFVGNMTQRVGTAGTKSKTGVGFEPTGLICLSSGVATGAITSASVSLGAGIGTGSTDQAVMSSYDRDDQAVTETYRFNNTGLVYAFQATTLICSASLNSFDSDGFTLDFDVVEAVNERYIPFLAFRDITGPGTIKLTADHSKIDSDLVNIPVVFNLGESVGADTDVNDDFTGTDNDPPNEEIWDLVGTQQNPFIYGSKVRFEIDNSVLDQQQLYSKFYLSGDFDIQIDFDLVLHPNTNTRESGIYLYSIADADDQYTFNRRYYSGDGEHYYANPKTAGSWGTATKSTTTDYFGKLRLVRSGSSWTAYKWNGSSWDTIRTGSGPAVDMFVYLWAKTTVTTMAITTDFDNFVINSGTIVWPYGDPNKYDCTPLFNELTYPVNDQFTGTNGDAPDSVRWEILSGTGEIQSNKLQQVATQSESQSNNKVQSIYQVVGNFDTQVDFEHNFSAISTSSAFLMLRHDDDNYVYVQILRTNSVFYYAAWKNVGSITTQVGSFETTTDTSGTFQIIQSDGTITLKGGGYTLGTVSDFANTVAFNVSCQSFNSDDFPTFQVDFDNFQVNSVDSIVWPDGEPNRKKIKVFTSDHTTQTYAEIEQGANFSDKKIVLHVKAPNLTAATDDEFFLDFDKTFTDNMTYIGDTGDAAAQAVWDSDFDLVIHKNQSPAGADSILDSTSNGNHGTTFNMDGSNIDSNGFLITNGTDEYINFGALTHRALFSVEVEMKRSGAAYENYVNPYKNDNPDNGNWIINTRDTGVVSFADWDGANTYRVVASTTVFDTGIPIFAAATFDVSDILRLFVNGALEATAVAATSDIWWVDDTLVIGVYSLSTSPGYRVGKTGELRISKIDRSTSWLKATSYSLNDNLLSMETFTVTKASDPVADPTSGTYDASQTIELSTTTGTATIYYTTDGTDPDETDTEYTTSISMFTGTLKAIAIDPTLDDSDIMTENYVISTVTKDNVFIIMI